jgi:hypothetical protein
MFKKGEKRTGDVFGSAAFRRRYFVLKERFLYYFKQPYDEDSIGTIDLGLVS